MVCQWFGLKTTRTVCQWFGLKIIRIVFSGLASKPVVTVLSGLPSKLVVMVSPVWSQNQWWVSWLSIKTKVVEGFLFWASKLTAMIW
jgi:hypothetical protein